VLNGRSNRFAQGVSRDTDSSARTIIPCVISLRSCDPSIARYFSSFAQAFSVVLPRRRSGSQSECCLTVPAYSAFYQSEFLELSITIPLHWVSCGIIGEFLGNRQEGYDVDRLVGRDDHETYFEAEPSLGTLDHCSRNLESGECSSRIQYDLECVVDLF
jgi:hypothetical protein